MQLRAVPVVLARGLGQPLPIVQCRDGPGHEQEPLPGPGHLVAQAEKQLVLQALALLGSPQELVLHLLEGRGDVPLAVDQGLAAHEMLGHLALVRLGDIEIVTENLVEPELELGDTAFRRLPLVQLAHPVLAVLVQLDEFVQLGIVSLAEQAAIRDHRGRGIGQGRG